MGSVSIKKKIEEILREFKLSISGLLKDSKTKVENIKEVDPDKTNLSTVELVNDRGQSYFIGAKSWADDIYTHAIISRNRYKFAFVIAIILAVVLSICVAELIPTLRLEPLLINHYQDGRISVEPMKQPYQPNNSAEVQSDLVRYVVSRESYDPVFYRSQYSLVNLMSNKKSSHSYRKVQSIQNKHSPVNVLRNRGWRSVHVDSVVFLDSKLKNKDDKKKRHKNVAQIDFIITDHFKNSSHHKVNSFIALVSWEYKGIPDNPGDRWRNWNGFTVTDYQLEQKNSR